MSISVGCNEIITIVLSDGSMLTYTWNDLFTSVIIEYMIIICDFFYLYFYVTFLHFYVTFLHFYVTFLHFYVTFL